MPKSLKWLKGFNGGFFFLLSNARMYVQFLFSMFFFSSVSFLNGVGLCSRSIMLQIYHIFPSIAHITY